MRSSDAVVAAVVERATGAPLAAKRRITAGYSNEVYDATTADGRRVIVRLHHPFLSDAPYFREERWALERCAEAGVPAPRVLLVEQVTDEANGGRCLSACVETPLEGTTLWDLLAAGARDGRGGEAGIGLLAEGARPVLIQAGAALSRLHSIRTAGFGPLDPTGRGAGATWADFVPDRTALPQLLAAAARAGFDQAEVTEAIERLEAHRPFWEAFWARAAPRLLHGDLKPQHIMVSEGRFTGFLDFEFPQSGDPAADLAHWDYYHGDLLPTAWLLAGYDPTLAAAETWPVRRLLHRVQHSLSKLRWHGLRDDAGSPFLELVRARLSQDLQDLRHGDRAGGDPGRQPGSVAGLPNASTT